MDFPAQPINQWISWNFDDFPQIKSIFLPHLTRYQVHQLVLISERETFSLPICLRLTMKSCLSIINRISIKSELKIETARKKTYRARQTWTNWLKFITIRLIEREWQKFNWIFRNCKIFLKIYQISRILCTVTFLTLKSKIYWFVLCLLPSKAHSRFIVEVFYARLIILHSLMPLALDFSMLLTTFRRMIRGMPLNLWQFIVNLTIYGVCVAINFNFYEREGAWLEELHN